MYCKYCRSILSDGARFCRRCGRSTADGSQVADALFGSTPSGQAGQPPFSRPVQPNHAQPVSYAQPPKTRKSSCGVIIGIVIAAALLIIGAICIIAALAGKPSGGTGGSDGSITVPTVPDGEVRPLYTTLRGGGEDTCTLLVYMVGSDLESEGGYASNDIQEMLAATSSGKLNIVLQTGGAKAWQLRTIAKAGSPVVRWYISNGRLELIEELDRDTHMLTAESLASFITFGAEHFPADRTSLILWDHGGGSLYGFGYDELHPNDAMTLSVLSSAFQMAGVKFDFVGFDACLMGSFETAFMLEPYADYMIASEETEPGTGWSYTGFLSWLGSNTSCRTPELGKHIVDDFIADSSRRDTLSVIDLRYIPGVYSAMQTYMKNIGDELSAGRMSRISRERVNAKSFAESDYDMIDLYDFVDQTDYRGADELRQAIRNAVSYQNDCSVRGVNGLSFYFPYYDISDYEDARVIFSSFGYGGSIVDFFDRFVSTMAGGRSQSNSRDNSGLEVGETPDLSGYSWFSPSDFNAAGDSLDYSKLELIWSDSAGHYILPLTEEDWERIDSILLEVLLKTDSGFIDLGRDQVFELDDDDNLVATFDGTWLALDGTIVPYTATDTIAHDDHSEFEGTVPALLNGETLIDIYLHWDSNDANAGYVLGYRIRNEADTVGKGFLSFNSGDVIEPVFSCYNSDGSEAEPQLGAAITVGIGGQLEVTYEPVGDHPTVMSYLITDIYQNIAWTELVEFKE